MWLTPCGERHFDGYSGSLLATGISRIIEEMTVDNLARSSLTLEIEIFDRLTFCQQIDCMHRLSKALFLAGEPAPAPTLYNEISLIAVFKMLRSEIEMEIGWGDTAIRNYVIGTFESEFFRMESTLDLSKDDKQYWFRLLDVFRENILHHRAFDQKRLESLPWSWVRSLTEVEWEIPAYFTHVPTHHPVGQAMELADETGHLCIDVIETAAQSL